MPRSFTFATIADYKTAKGTSGAIYAELVSSGIKSGSCVSKISATGDVFIDSINPFVTPDLGQEGDTLYYSSTEGYRFLRAGNSAWDADSLGQVYIDLAKIPSGFSVVAPYADIFNYKQTDENIGSGKASMTKILGNSVAWNQLFSFYLTSDVENNGITFSPQSDYSVKLNGTASGLAQARISSAIAVSNHKYYAKCAGAGSSMSSDVYCNWDLPAAKYFDSGGQILSSTSSSFGNLYLRVPRGKSCTNQKVYFSLIDLTLLYGSSIDGMTDAQILAKFESEFPNPYYAYNAGTLLSNKAKAIEFVGFNQWDEEWEVGGIDDNTGEPSSGNIQIRSKSFIPVIPGSNYYLFDGETSGAYGYMYDSNKNYLDRIRVNNSVYIQNKMFSVLSNCCYIKFKANRTTYNNNICINLSGKRNGQYEPYKKVVLPLPNLDQIKVYSHNLYDPVTGKAKVEGGKQYYIGGTYTSISQNGTAITVSSHLFTPSESGAVDVVGGNSTDTIINLSSSFNGQYEPHGILTIEGGLKSAGNVYDEIVGNKYIKRVGSVDLGTLTYYYESSRFRTVIETRKALSKNMLCVRYVTETLDVPIAYMTDKTVKSAGGTGTSIYFRDDSYTDTSSFKTAMSGVMLDYELATPIEYEIYSPTKMPFNWKYRVSPYHTKRMLPENGVDPTSAPFACEIKQI